MTDTISNEQVWENIESLSETLNNEIERIDNFISMIEQTEEEYNIFTATDLSDVKDIKDLLEEISDKISEIEENQLYDLSNIQLTKLNKRIDNVLYLIDSGPDLYTYHKLEIRYNKLNDLCEWYGLC